MSFRTGRTQTVSRPYACANVVPVLVDAYLDYYRSVRLQLDNQIDFLRHRHDIHPTPNHNLHIRSPPVKCNQ